MRKILVVICLCLFSVNLLASPLCDMADANSPYIKNFKGLVEGQEGWLFREHDLVTRFGPGRIGYEGLRELSEQLSAQGTQLIMVPIPTRGIVHPEQLGEVEYDVESARDAYRAYLDNLRALNILVPDMDEMFERASKVPLFFARDHHWTPEGAKVTAEIVQGLLEDQVADVEAVHFKSEAMGRDENPGSYSRAASELCQRSYPVEEFEVYRTEGQVDLFAEVLDPQIVLVGTSNSNGSMDFNFSGFLKEALGRDVANLAVSGGGYDEAIQTYLSSDSFRTNPPKFLIWEYPGYYSLNTSSFYEQLLASFGD